MKRILSTLVVSIAALALAGSALADGGSKPSQPPVKQPNASATQITPNSLPCSVSMFNQSVTLYVGSQSDLPNPNGVCATSQINLTDDGPYGFWVSVYDQNWNLIRGYSFPTAIGTGQMLSFDVSSYAAQPFHVRAWASSTYGPSSYTVNYDLTTN